MLKKFFPQSTLLFLLAALSLAFPVSHAADHYSFPIKPGEIGPIAQGNLQYPFLCQTNAAGLGDPVIDNYAERGTPVKDPSGKILGYSEFCGSPMRIDYFYKPLNKDEFLPLPKDVSGHYYYPRDLSLTEYGNNYIVRIERGTMNRFLYAIAMLQDPVANKTPQESGYKNKAVFNFKGGVGLGYNQASKSAYEIIHQPYKLIDDIDPITLGYAVIFSSSNATSTQYNLKLALKTAQMVKKQLAAEFGDLKYTIGFGGSGGAIQQYVFGQLDPHFLDGIIAVASFPDFITQTIYASDCALLEYYFDNTAYDAPTPWARRQLIEGFAASKDMPANNLGLDNPKTAKIRHDKFGSDTCINGWGGALPVVMNPYYGAVSGIDVIKVTKPIEWTSWGSESRRWQFGTYPTTAGNITPNTIDNVGVQYGLTALKSGQIDKITFFDLNKKVGGWKSVEQLQEEDNFPFSGPNKSYDGWSSKNATAAEAFSQSKIAPRKQGNLDAIYAAEKNGAILQGNLDLPILDIKEDSDDEGNMHSTVHSFVIRNRLEQFDKNHNQIIWIARLKQQEFWPAIKKIALSQSKKVETSSQVPPANSALKIMEEWVENVKNHPEKTIAANKPIYLKDGCFYMDGSKPNLEFGDSVWNGIIDQTQKKGICSEHFSIHPTPRMIAGWNFLGNIFNCELESVEQFVKKGGYGKVVMLKNDIEQLNKIFPAGVCAYSI